jgi:hypothetical protein
MSPLTNTEKITAEFEHEIKEAAHWFGGWDELRKKIAELEDNDNEAAFDRHCEDKLQNGEIV